MNASSVGESVSDMYTLLRLGLHDSQHPSRDRTFIAGTEAKRHVLLCVLMSYSPPCQRRADWGPYWNVALAALHYEHGCDRRGGLLVVPLFICAARCNLEVMYRSCDGNE
jgi:hypothetical protein